MRVSTPWRDRFWAVAGLSIIAVVWCGCSTSEETPSETKSRRHREQAANAGEPAVESDRGLAMSKAAQKSEATAEPGKTEAREEVVTKELEEIAAEACAIWARPWSTTFRTSARCDRRKRFGSIKRESKWC